MQKPDLSWCVDVVVRSIPFESDRNASIPVTPDEHYVEEPLSALSLHPTPPPSARRIIVEASMLNRAKLGDIGAFTEIVEAYYARCLRFARAVLKNPDDAEDMVQDTFVRLYRALPRYEERQKFEAWLFQILGNCCRTANTAFRRDAGRTVDDERALERVPSTDSPSAALD